MCSPKTMLKIGGVIAVVGLLGFIFVPQLRVAIIGLAPFALFALCPLGMLFGMAGMKNGKQDERCSSCEQPHTTTKHAEPNIS